MKRNNFKGALLLLKQNISRSKSLVNEKKKLEK